MMVVPVVWVAWVVAPELVAAGGAAASTQADKVEKVVDAVEVAAPALERAAPVLEGAAPALENAAVASEGAVAKAANTAYETAVAGGKHAGTLRNYAGRSVAEIQKAIGSYLKQVAIHGQKMANPAQFAERWGQMSAQEQAGLLFKWGLDAARNQELADVLRGLLETK